MSKTCIAAAPIPQLHLIGIITKAHVGTRPLLEMTIALALGAKGRLDARSLLVWRHGAVSP